MKKGEKVYALYKGDTFITLGTLREIADEIGIKYSSVQYFLTNTYRKKILNRKKPKNYKMLILIEDD